MILNHLKDKNIILGSGSPRRKLLLEGLHLPFKVIVKNADESFSDSLKREEVARFLAEVKASAFEGELKTDDLLITSDTIVCLEDEVLNKPQSEDEARGMLRKLSGKTHTVITAVSLTDSIRQKTFHDETSVTFGELSEEEIEFYIKQHQPFDKAGSYGAQEFMGYIAIQKLEGSYFNVMGLPVHRVWEELKVW